MVIVGIPTVDYIKLNPHQLRLKEIELINVKDQILKCQKFLNFFMKKIKFENMKLININ